MCVSVAIDTKRNKKPQNYYVMSDNFLSNRKILFYIFTQWKNRWFIKKWKLHFWNSHQAFKKSQNKSNSLEMRLNLVYRICVSISKIAFFIRSHRFPSHFGADTFNRKKEPWRCHQHTHFFLRFVLWTAQFLQFFNDFLPQKLMNYFTTVFFFSFDMKIQ